jgi:hypothetical protein
MIRRVTPAGIVTTRAGALDRTLNVVRIVDGTGSLARFDAPVGIAVARNGTVYVCDWDTIRKGMPVPNPSRIINVSVLATLAGGGDTVTVGAIIGGADRDGTKPILVRATKMTTGAGPLA